MKYWKNGFYLEQNKANTRVEITDEYWKELLNGQSNGKIIESDDNGYPILKDFVLSQKDLYEQEYQELKYWFESNYSYKEEKYRRLIALGKLDDDGISPQEKLILLYQEAENKRIRIQQLENLLN